MSELLVYFRGHKVGRAVSDESDRFDFTYDADWLAHRGSFPISFRLPLRRETWPADRAHIYFANLLPEGVAREAIANRLGVSVDNDVALLVAMGDDTAGAFRFVEPSIDEHRRKRGQERTPISIEDLRSWSKGDPALLSDYDQPPRLSLAGAQHKIGVVTDEDRNFYLAPFGEPSTHLLKFDAHRYPHLAANEYLTMQFAAALGLKVAEVEIDNRTERPFLVIERYDRMRVKNSASSHIEEVLRLHQEDFCQLLGRKPSRKYESEGGPGIQEIGHVVRRASATPAADLLRLVRWAIFGAIAGNADGHAKNLSLLYSPDGAGLAPFYDLVCTRAFVGLDTNLAMAIGGEANPDRLRLANFHKFAEDLGIRPRKVEEEVDQMLEGVDEAFATARSRLDKSIGFSPAVERVERAVQKRARAIGNNLAQDRGG